MTHERTPVTDPNEVWLGGRPFRVVSDVEWELTNIMGRPQNQGAAGPNDHPNYTTSIQQDWSGGALVKYMNPASDTGRFWWSTLETQYPGSISLPPITDVIAPPAGVTGTPWVLGDFRERLHVAWGQDIYIYDATNGTWTPTGSTGTKGSPVGPGVVYREFSDLSTYRLMMFVPTTGGYVTISDLGVVREGLDSIQVVDFEVWDQKIFKLSSDGQLSYATLEPTSADQWVAMTYIPDGTTPRRLLNYMDRNNNPALMVITDGSTFKFDFANTMLHLDDLVFPRHPHQGRAAANHNGSLMVSVGTGMHQYDNNTISAMGLDSRDGLPPEFRGFIKDMRSTYNGLYVLVQGEVIAPDNPTQTATMNLGGGDDQLYMTNYQTNNLVMLHNGFGWHYRWHAAGTAPTNIQISNAQTTYSLWWGSNGQLFRQQLQRIYFNPGDKETRGYRFAKSGEMITPWNDYNWIDQPKMLKAIELKIKGMVPGCSVAAYYKLDDDDNPWVLINNYTANGEKRTWLGLDDHEPDLKQTEPWKQENRQYKGIRHARYRLRFVMTRPDTKPSDEFISPVIEWYAVVARRWLRPQRTWFVRIGLEQKEKDWTIEQQYEHLMNLSLRQEGIVFEHKDEKHMVELTLLRGPSKLGRDDRMMLDVTLLESQDLDHPDDPLHETTT